MKALSRSFANAHPATTPRLPVHGYATAPWARTWRSPWCMWKTIFATVPCSPRPTARSPANACPTRSQHLEQSRKARRYFCRCNCAISILARVCAARVAAPACLSSCMRTDHYFCAGCPVSTSMRNPMGSATFGSSSATFGPTSSKVGRIMAKGSVNNLHAFLASFLRYTWY